MAMPAEWHRIHDKIKSSNPDMSDSEAWAIATNIYKKRHGGRTPQQDEKTSKQLRKIASRAWKRVFDSLGEKSVSRLKQKGILNHEKELEGLNRGSSEIAKKLGIPIKHWDDDEFYAEAIKRFRRRGLDTPTFTRDSVKGGSGFRTLFSVNNPRDSVIVKGNKSKEQFENSWFNYDKDFQVYKNTGGTLEQRYLDGIRLRHETDEARQAFKLLRDKNKYYPKNSEGLIEYRAKWWSHSDPHVIARESANAAIAPDAVKQNLVRVRNFEDFPGVEYGKSAVPNLKAARKHREYIVKEKARARAMGIKDMDAEPDF